MKDRKFEIEGTSNYNNNTKFAYVIRPNKNDCWNVALALALNLDYEVVRKKLDKKINENGTLNGYHSMKLLLKNNYEKINNHGYKTAKALADDTEYTNYEYVVSTSRHLVYIRKGVIYDSFKSDLKRIVRVFRRKISKRRKPIHNILK